jgi:very-short-patch-repair endonuclease
MRDVHSRDKDREREKKRVARGEHPWINRAPWGRRNVFHERLLDLFFPSEVLDANVNRNFRESIDEHSSMYECDYSLEAIRLDLEIDDVGHLKSQDYDRKRNNLARKYGWLVLRYWWYDVELRMDRVVQMSYFAYNRQRKKFRQFQLPKLRWTYAYQILAERLMKSLQFWKLRSVLEQRKEKL